jgi:hypothetical protein
MKKLLLSAVLSAFTFCGFTQTWQPMSTGIAGQVNAIVSYNGSIYAGGSFLYDGAFVLTLNNISKWNGTAWTLVGTGMDSYIEEMIVFNGDLYACGAFTTADGVSANRIAKYNGTSWSALGTGMNGTVYAMEVYNGNLYAAGEFTTAGGVSANNIAMWNGTTWSAVGTGTTDRINTLAVLGTNLYAGGRFVSPASYIAKWNGTAWSAVGAGTSYYVYDMEVHGTELLIAGDFSTPDNFITKWNGSAFVSVGGLSFGEGICHTTVSYGGGIYIGGNYVGGNCVEVFGGSNFVPVNATPPYPTATVYDLASINGVLYAGGNFNTGNLYGIATWTAPVGIDDTEGNFNSLVAYPNPFNNSFSVSMEILQEMNFALSITNILGEVVYTENVNNSHGAYKKEIDASSLEAGIYFVNIFPENGLSYSLKLIKE